MDAIERGDNEETEILSDRRASSGGRNVADHLYCKGSAYFCCSKAARLVVHPHVPKTTPRCRNDQSSARGPVPPRHQRKRHHAIDRRVLPLPTWHAVAIAARQHDAAAYDSRGKPIPRPLQHQKRKDRAEKLQKGYSVDSRDLYPCRLHPLLSLELTCISARASGEPHSQQ